MVLQARLPRNPKVRPRLIKYALFQSLTGRRLRGVFGDACVEWDWENASPEIGGCPSSSFPADPEHIRSAIEECDPDVVLAFGRVAERALGEICGDARRLIVGPHPAARQDDVVDRLRRMADALEETTRCERS